MAAGEPISCDNKRIPAALLEESVLREIAHARLPDAAIEAARAMLKDRLAKPADHAAGGKRRRLERALESLRKQHQWGDLTDEDYRTERREIEAALATLPARSTDTLVAFDEASGCCRCQRPSPPPPWSAGRRSSFCSQSA